MAAGDPGETWTLFALPVAGLRRMLEQTAYAASTEETRYYLRGVRFGIDDADGPKLAAVATDGHRMGVAAIAVPPGAEGMPEIIVPSAAAAALGKMLAKLDGSAPVAVAVRRHPAGVSFGLPPAATGGATGGAAGGGSVLTVKLIDGTFPAYQRVIPRRSAEPGDNGYANTMAFDAPALLETVGRIVAASEDPKRACVTLEGVEGGGVAVSSAGSGAAHAETVPGAAWTGRPIRIGFQARYLRDALARIGGRTEMLCAGSGDPVRLDGPDGTHVIMPMRV